MDSSNIQRTQRLQSHYQAQHPSCLSSTASSMLVWCRPVFAWTKLQMLPCCLFLFLVSSIYLPMSNRAQPIVQLSTAGTPYLAQGLHSDFFSLLLFIDLCTTHECFHVFFWPPLFVSWCYNFVASPRLQVVWWQHILMKTKKVLARTESIAADSLEHPAIFKVMVILWVEIVVVRVSKKIVWEKREAN